jgi:hypothetical protein
MTASTRPAAKTNTTSSPDRTGHCRRATPMSGRGAAPARLEGSPGVRRSGCCGGAVLAGGLPVSAVVIGPWCDAGPLPGYRSVDCTWLRPVAGKPRSYRNRGDPARQRPRPASPPAGLAQRRLQPASTTTGVSSCSCRGSTNWSGRTRNTDATDYFASEWPRSRPECSSCSGNSGKRAGVLPRRLRPGLLGQQRPLLRHGRRARVRLRPACRARRGSGVRDRARR